jgi:hypothetical protein
MVSVAPTVTGGVPLPYDVRSQEYCVVTTVGGGPFGLGDGEGEVVGDGEVEGVGDPVAVGETDVVGVGESVAAASRGAAVAALAAVPPVASIASIARTPASSTFGTADKRAMIPVQSMPHPFQDIGVISGNSLTAYG